LEKDDVAAALVLSHKRSSLPGIQHPICTQSQDTSLFLVLHKTRC